MSDSEFDFPQPTPQGLDKLRALATEHFDDFVIIVSKDKKLWSGYSHAANAIGMMQHLDQNIRDDWREMRNPSKNLE